MLNTNVWARHSVEKNVDFMQNMSCSLPSPEAIHAARFMQRIHAEYRHASCRLPIPDVRTSIQFVPSTHQVVIQVVKAKG